MLTDMLSCICMLTSNIHLFILLKIRKKTESNELSELKYLKTPSQKSTYAHWHVFLYLLALTCIKILIHLSHLKSEKKIEQNELNELECSKTPSQISSFAHKHVSCICMPKQAHSSIYPTQNQKKRLKKIWLEFFIKKTLSLSTADSRPGELIWGPESWFVVLRA